jgi:AAA domain
LAKILNAPRPVNIIPFERLQQLAAMLPEEPKREAGIVNRHSFDIDSWIANRGLDIANKGNWNGGRKWIPAICPWNSNHDNRSAYIIKQASGAIVAGCHHNGCNDKNWHDLRDVVEPGWREKRGNSSGPTIAKSEETSKTTHLFTLISAKDVMATEDVEQAWIWEGILPAGGMSLLVAKPKVGKTTLAFNLAVAVSRGGEFLDRQTAQGAVVYLALEEKRGEIKKKLTAAGISEESIKFHFGSAPVDAMTQVEPLIIATQAKLLVIDVLQKFCRLRDLNDYAIVTNALEPLMAAARKQGCHILLTHHAGKADRPDGDDILGSTGLLGGVDTSIHIKKRDKRRAFFTIQRYGDDVEETVIDLGEDGSLRAVGSRQDVDLDETKPLILAVLKGSEEPLTMADLYEHVEKSKALVSKAVGILFKDDHILRSGSGKKNDAYKYSQKIPPLPPPDTHRGTKGSIFSADNATKSHEKCCPDAFQLFSPKNKMSGAAFSAQKSRGDQASNKAQNRPIVDEALRIFGGRIRESE